MADYNIYIHSYGQYDSPTTPTQLRAESDVSGVGGEGGGSGGSGFGAIRRAASFLTNPDSIIGHISGAFTKASGVIIPVLVIGAAIKVTTKVMDLQLPYVARASGDYQRINEYNNFKQIIQNVTHPFSTFVSIRQTKLEISKANEKNEQQRLLIGETIYSSRYGRNL